MVRFALLLAIAVHTRQSKGFSSSQGSRSLGLWRHPTALFEEIEPSESDVTSAETESATDAAVPLHVNFTDNAQDTTLRIEDTDGNGKRAMLKFALPALGIFLCNPLLSNIDNAFVGLTTKTGLAALSPATICTDQMLYLFSFLGRATTGLVARAYGGTEQNTEKARSAAASPLSVALICGAFLSVFYAAATPRMLGALNVHPSLRPEAASYIYWRGSITWAALAQNVCLSILLATRDAVTPLKIVGLAALVNVVGDAALCAWPCQWGCAGAAAATAGATLVSCVGMVRALRNKQLLPKVRIPTKAEFGELLEFTGPLFAITVARLAGFLLMQQHAMKLGLKPLAAYQLAVNVFFFFLLFGEPLSQVAQTKLPPLLDSNNTKAVRSTFRSVISLGSMVATGIGLAAGAFLWTATPLFTSDAVVQAMARQTSPTIALAVATTIFAVAIDGAYLAARDFGFMLSVAIASTGLQMWLLRFSNSISFILNTFTVRLATYAVASLVRAAMGGGPLGRALKGKKTTA